MDECKEDENQVFFKNIEKISATLMHTKEHANQNRRKYYAMTYEL